ncbi:MAG: isoprenylcysteine carboxylmethyltransferase family protein [Planctomycetota bacterium]
MSVSATYFRHRSTVLLLLVAPILALVLGPRVAAPEELATGTALAIGGALLRLASMRCIGRGARVHRADVRGQLVTWGPYSWSRNPLYLAAAMILAGLAVNAGASWWGLLLLPGAFLVYTPVVKHEEVAIAESAGEEYERYRASVSRWIGLPAKSEDAPPERVGWGEVLRREVGLIPGVVVGIVGVVLVSRDVLPLRRLLSSLVPEGVPPAAVALGLLGLGALINSLGLERKRRRHEARRAANREREASGTA